MHIEIQFRTARRKENADLVSPKKRLADNKYLQIVIEKMPVVPRRVGKHQQGSIVVKIW